MTDESLLSHVADIVSAHVSNNNVPGSDLPGLIRSVHASLSGLGNPPAPAAEKPVPAVSVRSSVKPDAIACLECGAKMKVLKRHLAADHGLTPAEYRARWSLAPDYPMVSRDYSERRKSLAVKIGLGRKPRKPAEQPAEQPAPPGTAAPRKKAAPAASAAAAAKKAAPAPKMAADAGVAASEAAPAPAKSRKKLGLSFAAKSSGDA